MTVFAVIDAFHTLLTIGHYEDRITVFTHGRPDLPPAMYAYDLFAYVMDPVGYALGIPGAADTIGELGWLLALVLTVAVVPAWLHRSWGSLRTDKVLLGWLGAALAFKVASVVYDAVAAPPDPSVDGVLATRLVAYPLWVVATVVLVVAARVARTTALSASPGRA